MLKMTLPDRCKFARERVHLSHQAAADAIGCARPTVIRWEVDARSVSSRYLHAAARAYKVRPEWLSMDSADDGYPWAPIESGKVTAGYHVADSGRWDDYLRADPHVQRAIDWLLLPPKGRSKLSDQAQMAIGALENEARKSANAAAAAPRMVGR